MRIRHAAFAVAMVAVATIPLASTADAVPVGDRDCKDFATREQAQAAFDLDPSDPERLDADNDGLACEERPSVPGSANTTTPGAVPAPPSAATGPAGAAEGSAAVVGRTPTGAVAAGFGPTDPGHGWLAGGTALIAAGLTTGVATVMVRRRHTSPRTA
ncbi:excalibur calcium-binding domain-containing protein [Embleya sp. NPDC127516]|uniref:excalibur calcium-binding domain-containing protein n=1 Tax=Embleya sp. NPDC127516 TaxID=3363990 RepID=UPI003800793A